MLLQPGTEPIYSHAYSPYSDSDSDHEDEEEHPATCPGEILNLNRSRQSIGTCNLTQRAAHIFM